MQIVEVTGYAIRSAAVTLRRAETPLKFTLFPMVHVAAPSFYTEVRRRLRSCDLIVAEGVDAGRRTLQTDAMEFADRYFPRGRQRGLVGQTNEAVLPKGIPVIWPEVPPVDLQAEMTKLPYLTKLSLIAGNHLLAVALATAGPGIFLRDDFAVHDLPFTAGEEQVADSPMAHTLLDGRDKVLVATLVDIHERRKAEPITVGVVYGALHMPAVANGLMSRYRYRPREAEWMTVFVPG